MTPDPSYRRFAAPPQLRGVVEHVWVVRCPPAPEVEIVLPDGHGVVQVVVGQVPTLRGPSGPAEPDGTGIRGPLRHTRVRTQPGSVRLGAQLHPLGLARLLGPVPPLVDALVPADPVLSGDQVRSVSELLARGSDAEAAAALLDQLAAAPRYDSPEADRLDDALDQVAVLRGLVRPADLARNAGVALPVLHRSFTALLGQDPAAHLAAVRFSTFVRESVGLGSVTPSRVLAAVEWYVRAGYPPREVERFTGLAPADLRRLAEWLADEVGEPAR